MVGPARSCCQSRHRNILRNHNRNGSKFIKQVRTEKTFISLFYPTMNCQHFQAIKLADFEKIKSIQTFASNYDSKEKGIVQMDVQGAPQLLTISCNDITEAESLADLIDGYVKMASNSNISIWNRKGMSNASNTVEN